MYSINQKLQGSHDPITFTWLTNKYLLLVPLLLFTTESDVLKLTDFYSSEPFSICENVALMVFKELRFCSQAFPMMYDNHDFNQVDSFIPFAVLGFYSNNGAPTFYVELKPICT